jgi:hypothetical protein
MDASPSSRPCKVINSLNFYQVYFDGCSSCEPNEIIDAQVNYQLVLLFQQIGYVYEIF